jgi:hypothetical protein
MDVHVLFLKHTFIFIYVYTNFGGVLARVPSSAGAVSCFVSCLHQLQPGLRKWLVHPVFHEREAMGSFPVLGVREGSGVACSTWKNVNMLALSLAGHSQWGTQCPAAVDKRQHCKGQQ